MRNYLRISHLFALGILVVLAGCDGGATTDVRVDPGAECADVRPLSDSDNCTDLRSYLRNAGTLNTAGDASGIAAAAGIAYVADGGNGVLIVDACDPARMSVMSRVENPGSVRGIDVAGGLAYAAWGSVGLVIIDASDPGSPTILSVSGGGGNAVDVMVDAENGLAYVADDVLGLMIYDVSQPRLPSLLGVENTPGNARAVCVQGPIAYVADARLGLRIASVDDPQSPWLVTSVGTPGEANDVTVSGRYAYVADGTAGLTIIDIDSPFSASVVGGVDTADRATAVAVTDTIAFVLDKRDGLLIYSITDPTSPSLIARSSGEGQASALALSRDYAYVADGFGGLRVVDVRVPAHAPVLSEVPSLFGPTMTVHAQGPYVYGVDDRRVYIAEWLDGELRYADFRWLDAAATNITPYEGRLYICTEDRGVNILDVSISPLHPGLVGAIPGTAGSVDVAFADSVAFTVRTGLSKPVVYDMRTHIVYALTGISGGVVKAVDTGASFAYFVAIQGKLWVVSLNPTSPAPVRLLMSTRGNSTDVHVRGDLLTGERLFVANRFGFAEFGGGAGVEVYDLSNALIPEFVAFIETSIPAERIAFNGDLMYVVGGSDGLEVFNVSDPYSPVPVGSFWNEHPVHGAVAVDGAIILANDEGGLIAIPAPCDTP